MQSWQELFTKLRYFWQVYGHCNVPHPWKEDSILSQWVVNLRQAHTRLPRELRLALDELGFDFTPTVTWDTFYGQLEAFYKQHGHLHVSGKQREYAGLQEWILQQRQVKHLLNAEQLRLLDQLGFSWESPLSKESLWEKQFNELLRFKQQYGHLKVPSTFQENPSLAKWVSRQRENEESMPRERKERLDQVGFLWKKDMDQWEKQAWLQKFEQLKAFALKEGHCKVPALVEEYRFLRPWLDRQRRFRHRLTPEQEQSLQSIGFPWAEDLRQESLKQWQQKIADLTAFKERFGHCRVSSHWKENPSLAAWVSSLRRRKEELSAQQQSTLQELGFVWSTDIKKQQQHKWLSLYRELKAFQEQHGHTRVPEKSPTYYSLSRWVSWQRQQQQKNKLSPRRIKLLNQIGFDWDVNRERENQLRWDRMYIRLKRFFRKYGHTKVPEEYKADPKLATWVAMQRQYEWRLSPERKQQLQAVSFLFGADLQRQRNQTWEEMYTRLSQFKQIHGHCRVSIAHPDNKLFGWVAKQRKKKDQLPADRLEKLNALGFTWQEDTQKRLQDQWQSFYGQLLTFRQQQGHSNIPEGWQENPALATWVSHQRRKEHTLPEERKQLLEQIGFCWKADLNEQKEADWEEKYKQLEGFKQTYGHCQVPANWAANPSLGVWVFRQRKRYRQGILAEHRKEKLDQLQFEWQVKKGPRQ